VEYFAEMLIPVLSDLPLVEELNVTLAGRMSDYSTVGNVESYKADLDWTVVDGFRVRGGLQHAVRAPAIGELFAPQLLGFPNIGNPNNGATGLFSGDPCDIRSAYRSTNGAGDIVLPPGTYQCRVSAPAYGVSTHQIRLRTSAGTTLVFGTTAYSGNGAANDRSLAEGQLTLTGTTTVRVQHWCSSGNSGNGLGALDNDADIWGDVPNFNIFAIAEFWKIK
jgi:hypothetical protein